MPGQGFVYAEDGVSGAVHLIPCACVGHELIDTVQTFRARVAEKTGIPLPHLRVIFAGKHLEDVEADTVLCDLFIAHTDLVYYVDERRQDQGRFSRQHDECDNSGAVYETEYCHRHGDVSTYNTPAPLPQHDNIRLYIRTLTGKTLVLHYGRDWRWHHVKQAVYDMEGIPPAESILLASGRIVSCCDYVCDSDLGDRAAHLILRLHFSFNNAILMETPARVEMALQGCLHHVPAVITALILSYCTPCQRYVWSGDTDLHGHDACCMRSRANTTPISVESFAPCLFLPILVPPIGRDPKEVGAGPRLVALTGHNAQDTTLVDTLKGITWQDVVACCFDIKDHTVQLLPSTQTAYSASSSSSSSSSRDPQPMTLPGPQTRLLPVQVKWVYSDGVSWYQRDKVMKCLGSGKASRKVAKLTIEAAVGLQQDVTYCVLVMRHIVPPQSEASGAVEEEKVGMTRPGASSTPLWPPPASSNMVYWQSGLRKPSGDRWCIMTRLLLRYQNELRVT